MNRSMNAVSLPSLFPTGDYKILFVFYTGNEYVGSVNFIYSIQVIQN